MAPEKTRSMLTSSPSMKQTQQHTCEHIGNSRKAEHELQVQGLSKTSRNAWLEEKRQRTSLCKIYILPMPSYDEKQARTDIVASAKSQCGNVTRKDLVWFTSNSQSEGR